MCHVITKREKDERLLLNLMLLSIANLIIVHPDITNHIHQLMTFTKCKGHHAWDFKRR